MTKPTYSLIVELPEGFFRGYLLKADSISIGRSDGNAIALSEDAVSSRHCELRRRDSGFEIVDLGSTNGTRLNGSALGSEPRELREGDQLLIGTTVKARILPVVEIHDSVKKEAGSTGATTRKLKKTETPSQVPPLNPVAAAVAKASRGKGKGK